MVAINRYKNTDTNTITGANCTGIVAHTIDYNRYISNSASGGKLYFILAKPVVNKYWNQTTGLHENPGHCFIKMFLV